MITPRSNVKEITRGENTIEKEKEKAYNVTDNINTHMDQINIKIKMDSACSRNMSGVGGRITEVQIADNTIRGFKGEESKANLIGKNEDGKVELYVEDMPTDLVLLSANNYAEDGAVVLLPNYGLHLYMDDNERDEFETFIRKYKTGKVMEVNNRTYEVIASEGEEALSANSHRYFNTNINVSNVEERILAYLLSGFTITAMIKQLEDKSIAGVHPDVTIAALQKFATKWGHSPDVAQLAKPTKMGNIKGYMAVPEELKEVGDKVEADFFESDFNELPVEPKENVSEDVTIKKKKTKKLPTHGGAVAGFLVVDCYSQFLMGQLVKSTANAAELVKETIDKYAIDGHKIQLFSADSGVTSQSTFRVFTTAVEKVCLDERIETRRGEPHNHSNGTQTIEGMIRPVRNLMRMAMQYILRNPNLPQLGFTKEQILKLWGEIFYWAIDVMNMKLCKKEPTKTRWEVFKKRIPNVQEIRFLPIFAFVMVLRHALPEASLDGADREFLQYGLYVGPDKKVKGAIRAAILTGAGVKIIVTTKYKGVSDGGGINIYPMVQRGLTNIIADQTEENEQDDKVSYVDDENVFDVAPKAKETKTRKKKNTAKKEPTTDRHTQGQDDETRVEVTHELPEQQEENVEEDCNKQAANGKIDTNIVQKKRHRKKKESVTDNDTTNMASADKDRKMAKDTTSMMEKESLPEKESTVKERVSARRKTRSMQETAYFADWGCVQQETAFYSFSESAFIRISDEMIGENEVIEGYRAVTEGVPRNYVAALADKEWGDAARTEWKTIADARCIVEVDPQLAREEIEKNGADLVILFPVYEEKLKEGKIVKKVRLVGNGKTHYGAGKTYSPTPSREELFTLLHLIGTFDWEYIHIDEIRAFLNAPYKGENKVYTRLKGDKKMYEVIGALYGLKTSPRDYNSVVAERLKDMGYSRLHLCSCIYIKREGDALVIVFDFVDDFIVTSNRTESILTFISEFRERANTTEPEWNQSNLLGMKITRNREKRAMCLSVENKIKELAERFLDLNKLKKRDKPIPDGGFIVREDDLDDLGEDGEFISGEDIKEYMRLVGALLWISGVRHDSVYAMMYLTWFTKSPRRHHMNMAIHLLEYLYSTRSIELVLGGRKKITIDGHTDASLGTGRKGRSITAQIVSCGGGAIIAKATSTAQVRLSSFTAELDGLVNVIKSGLLLDNILKEMGITVEDVQLWTDNEALSDFVNGDRVAKAVRSMELRMWFAQEHVKMGNVKVNFMRGKEIPSDKLTKITSVKEFEDFRYFVMGTFLLDANMSTVVDDSLAGGDHENAKNDCITSDQAEKN